MSNLLVAGLITCAGLLYGIHCMPGPPDMGDKEGEETEEQCSMIEATEVPPLITDTYTFGENPTPPSIRVENVHVTCLVQGEKKGEYSYVSVLVNYTCDGGHCPEGPTVSQFDFSCDDRNGQYLWTAMVFFSADFVRTDNPRSNFSTVAKTGCGYCATPEALGTVGLGDLVADDITHCVECDSSCDEGLMRCNSHRAESCCNYYNHSTNSCIAECPLNEGHYLIEEDFTCTCEPGYSGNLCSENVDECSIAEQKNSSESLCENGGSCVDTEGSFNCSCPGGFYGRLCEKKHGVCNTTPCWNGATCTEGEDNAYTCECASGFTGSNCEETDVCASRPCKNNATCAKNSTGSELGFTCECNEGWHGSTCEQCLTKNCKACDGSPASCTECEEAFQLSDDGVCDKCASGYKDTSIGACTKAGESRRGEDEEGLTVGAIVGIAVGVSLLIVVFVLVVVIILLVVRRRKN